MPKYRQNCFFAKILQIDKFEGADFRYDNSFLKILAQKYQNKAFLVPNLAIFIISWNVVIRDQVEGECDNSFFKLYAKKPLK